MIPTQPADRAPVQTRQRFERSRALRVDRRTLRTRHTRPLALSASAKRPQQKAKLLYVVFDVLFVEGKDIRDRPLLERKETPRTLLPRESLLRYSEHVAEFGKREFAKAQRAHEEGVIAKRAAGLYYSGKRTREWLKFKAVHEQEVVIVVTLEPRSVPQVLWLAGACGA